VKTSQVAASHLLLLAFFTSVASTAKANDAIDALVK